jgi:Protein of unknown function (DUF2971)
VLPSRQLRLSPYRVMRDPAENKDFLPAVAFFSDPPNAEQASWDAAWQLEQHRDAARVLSFTREAMGPDAAGGTHDSCWARPRMWEQYGDVHRGVCLVFRRDRLEDTLRARLAGQGNHFLGDVRYSAAGIADTPLRTIVDERIFDDARRTQVVGDLVERHREDFFLAKTLDWATKYEFRAVLLGAADDYIFVAFADTLVAVVVGEKFPKWQLPGARSVCETACAELRRVLWDKGRPMCLRPR